MFIDGSIGTWTVFGPLCLILLALSSSCRAIPHQLLSGQRVQMHDIANLQGMYPVVKLAHSKHVTADVLALVTFPQALDLPQVVEAADKLALVLFARDGKKALHLAVGGHGT